MRLKVLVDHKEIRNCLEEIYETHSVENFLQATYLIDSQKIHLRRLDTFKQISAKNIECELSRILPFQIFFT